MSDGKTYVLRRGMTGVPNATVWDQRLSYPALGLLTYLLARPDGMPAGYRDLQGRGLGREATLAALRELDTLGYRHMVRRTGERGRFVTDVVVSEVPITPEDARERLDERLGQATLGLGTARRKAAHGATRRNAASAQVAPRAGSPEHGQPEPGPAAHRTTSSKVTQSLRSESPEIPSARDEECPHGDPRGLRLIAGTDRVRCPLCRRGLVPGVAPWDAEPPQADVIPLDARARAAGDTLEGLL